MNDEQNGVFINYDQDYRDGGEGGDNSRFINEARSTKSGS